MKFIIGKDFTGRDEKIFAINYGEQIKGKFSNNRHQFVLPTDRGFKFVLGHTTLYREISLGAYNMQLFNKPKLGDHFRARCVVYPDRRIVDIERLK